MWKLKRTQSTSTVSMFMTKINLAIALVSLGLISYVFYMVNEK